MARRPPSTRPRSRGRRSRAGSRRSRPRPRRPRRPRRARRRRTRPPRPSQKRAAQPLASEGEPEERRKDRDGTEDQADRRRGRRVEREARSDTWFSQSTTAANASTRTYRRSILSVRSTTQRQRDEDRTGERVPDRRVRRAAATPSSRMYFVTLRLSAHRTTVVRSISSTDVGRRTLRRYRARLEARAREAARRRASAQPRFAAGLAGLGCGMLPMRTSRPRAPRAPVARRSAPMPTTSVGVEHVDDPRECLVADAEERSTLFGRKLVRSAVPSGFVHEDERAPVRDEDPVEEPVGRREAIARPAPESGAAHLRARTREARDRPPRMLASRPADRSRDPDEVAHHRDVAERNARLRHAERPGVHADQQHSLSASFVAPALEVRLVRHAGVDERVVDERHRREVERLDPRRQLCADVDERHTRIPS